MSLATRCTACGTIFRVVEDQLRVSEGWVRCGRCAEVFDAREQLFDIDLEAPPPWPPAPAHDAPAVDLSTQDDTQWAPSPAPSAATAPRATAAYVPPTPATTPAQHLARAEHAAARHDHDSIVAAAMDSRQEPRWIDEADAGDAASASAPAARWNEGGIEPSLEQQVAQEVEQEMARLSAQRAQLEAQAQAEADIQQQAYEEEQARLRAEQAAAEASLRAQAQLAQIHARPSALSSADEEHGFQPTTLGEGGELPAPAEATSAAAGNEAAIGTSAGKANAEPAAADLPTFMRPARQDTLWNRLWVRVSLGLLCGLALAALSLQATWHFRDALVARYPQLRSDLQAFCAAAHCQIKPWQRLDSFSVDASALSQAGSGHHYKLALTLRNKSEFELALPWVELSLTDANGQLIARRALAPKDFNLSQDALAAATELPVQALLTTGDKAVSGYSVELFYP